MHNATVSAKGARRWAAGHPWIYHSDLVTAPDVDAGVVRVMDQRGKPLGVALWSPRSEISLRLLDPNADATIDDTWWRHALARALARRSTLVHGTNACRLVHGEGDAIPSLIVDRYDRWLVIQILSAGLDSLRPSIIAALVEVLGPEGILLRHDTAARRREGLSEEVIEAHGTVPREVVVQEGDIRYSADLWQGQKTGAFLDQRENRLLAGRLMRDGGRALDCFAYHGSFAVHLAQRAATVMALDVSEQALERGAANAA